MANSGVIELRDQFNTIYGIFNWTIREQYGSTLKSMIDWELYAINSSYIYMLPTRYEVYVDGKEIAFWNATTNDKRIISEQESLLLDSGSFTVLHSGDGTGSMNVSVKLGYTLWNDTSSVTSSSSDSAKFELERIYVYPDVICAGGSVGDTVSIVINKAAAKYTHTISYYFGSKSGTLVEKFDGSRYDWTIPEEFNEEFSGSAVKTCTLYCTVMNGNSALGTSFCEFPIRISAAEGAPKLAPDIKDIKEATLALTGDENTLVRYESNVEYAFNVSTYNNVPVENYTLTNGSKSVSGMAQGVLQDIESDTFVFEVLDSIGFTSTETVIKDTINYVKPTCYIDFNTVLEDVTSAKITVLVSGKYFSGSFGAVNNTLLLEIRHTDASGVMGDWEVIEYTSPSFRSDDNTYNIEVDFSGFDYTKKYTFQARITDKLNTVISAPEQVQLLPVFDWSEEDFNFNVPINMYGATILRHNREAKNTVLSANDGHIYLRPAGTDDTSTETILYPSGKVEFSNEISIKNQNIDYIIDYGTEAMGTNGTWYWEKWKSGKAICYGCRNFGRIGTLVSSEWRNWYVSNTTFSQDFPSGLFAATPDVIHIEVRDADLGGFVVLRYDDCAPSASNSGNFILGRQSTASTTLQTNISFNIMGRWK